MQEWQCIECFHARPLPKGDTQRVLSSASCFTLVPSLFSRLFSSWSRDSSIGIAARGLEGPGIKSRWGGEIFLTSPDRRWGPTSLLYNGYRVFHGGTAAGAWRWPPTQSSPEVKERVQLYLYSPLGPSWTVLGWNSPLRFVQKLLTPSSSSSRPFNLSSNNVFLRKIRLIQLIFLPFFVKWMFLSFWLRVAIHFSHGRTDWSFPPSSAPYFKTFKILLTCFPQYTRFGTTQNYAHEQYNNMHNSNESLTIQYRTEFYHRLWQ